MGDHVIELRAAEEPDGQLIAAVRGWGFAVGILAEEPGAVGVEFVVQGGGGVGEEEEERK